MHLKSLSLPLAVALSTLGVVLEAKANTISSFYRADSAGEISVDLLAQQRSTPLATLNAQDRQAHINLRSRPTIYSSAMGYGLVEDRVELLQCVQDYDIPDSDRNWCRVRFPQSGAIGWIRSDFIIFPSDGE